MISPGALAVYSHLLCCKNRKACHQDWLSHRAIGRAVKMSANTIHKYMCELEERQLISTEGMTVTTRDGLKHSGNLLYPIRPIQLALDQLIPRNPTDDCIAPKVQKVEMKTLLPEHLKSYLDAANAKDVLPMFYLELVDQNTHPHLHTHRI